MHTEESKKKISEKLKNIPKSKEHKQKLSESHKGKLRPDLKGKKQSDETKKKKSEAMKGKKLNFSNPEQRNKNLSDALKGKPCANKGKKQSKEWVEKRAQAQLGKPKPLSEEKLKIKVTKQYLTRKKNNTFNTSNIENNLYNELLNKYNNKIIYRQYKDDIRYPFYCDFYIPSEDLFIELNNHWTHGGKPYNPDDEECKKQLLEWQEKAKTSQFYQNAINTWTIRDVKKQEYAKKYNLNYKIIY